MCYGQWLIIFQLFFYFLTFRNKKFKYNVKLYGNLIVYSFFGSCGTGTQASFLIYNYNSNKNSISVRCNSTLCNSFSKILTQINSLYYNLTGYFTSLQSFSYLNYLFTVTTTKSTTASLFQCYTYIFDSVLQFSSVRTVSCTNTNYCFIISGVVNLYIFQFIYILKFCFFNNFIFKDFI